MIASVKYQMEMMSTKNANNNREQKCLLITNRAEDEEHYSTMQPPINLTTNNCSSSLLLKKDCQRNGQRKKSITSNGKIGGTFHKNTKRTDSLLTDEMELDNLQNEEGITIIDSSDDEDNLLTNFASINNFKRLEEENDALRENKEQEEGYILNLKIKISKRLKKLKPSNCCCIIPFWWRTNDNVEFKQFN